MQVVKSYILQTPAEIFQKKNNWIIYPSPTELKSSLKSSLRHYVNVPKTGGCIGCFASSGNETIRSFTKYYFKGNLSSLM